MRCSPLEPETLTKDCKFKYSNKIFQMQCHSAAIQNFRRFTGIQIEYKGGRSIEGPVQRPEERAFRCLPGS